MESVHGSGGLVATELSHIKQLVTQLEVHLAEPPPPDLCKTLASQIFSLTERSIAIVSSADFQTSGRKRSAAGLASATPSPISDVVVDAPFRTNKKSKTTTRRHQVRVKAADGGGAPVDDGHSWRKYGQKPILGAQHPRSYYRCRHRHSQGCTAMKKVQRADQDPTLFDVIYFGTHTCVETTTTTTAAAGQLAAPAPPPEQHNPDAGSLLQQSLSGNMMTVKTEGQAAAATEPQGWNDDDDDITPRFYPASTSDYISDEFLDIDVISSLFS